MVKSERRSTQWMWNQMQTQTRGVTKQLLITVIFCTCALSYQAREIIIHPVFFQEMFSLLQMLLGACQCVGLCE